MFSILDDSDWKEVFNYAQPTHICHKCHNKEHRVGGPEATICSPDIDTSPFTREDVEVIIGMVNGENDGPNWVGVFLLKDGRYVSITAGCDYTGWG